MPRNSEKLKKEFDDLEIKPIGDIVVPGIFPPSANRTKTWHWARTMRAKREWTDRIELETLAQFFQLRRDSALPPHVWIQLRLYFPDLRRRDSDNFSPKMLTDGLVKGKLIPDDSTKYVTWLPTMITLDRKKPRTVLRIFDRCPILYHRSMSDE